MFRTMMIAMAGAGIFCTAACAQEPDSGPSSTVTVDRTNPVSEGDLPTISLSPAFANLTFARPVQITHAGDGTDRLFVLEQRGRVLVFENRASVDRAHEFLDIRQRVFMGHNEEGLLSIAFHPNYAENGRFYVWYSEGERGGERRTVLSRFTVSSDDPNRADADSEQRVLEVEQPWGNHNGATVLFGPDGYLYVSIGDGGAANDPRNYSQNNESLLGTIIRIDVDNAEGDRPYAIPADNPFVDDESARGEIWAYGLRNVWRMSFDRETGELWAGDVGQNAWEAVYLIEKGQNYGWNIREGSQPFRRGVEVDVPLIDPVIEYSHRQGQSITGGYVYRGVQNEKLRGAYVYADYVSGRIWALRYDRETQQVTANREVFPDGRRPHVTSFGEDEAGELYICAFDRLDGRGSSDGRILRIVEH